MACRALLGRHWLQADDAVERYVLRAFTQTDVNIRSQEQRDIEITVNNAQQSMLS